jgi:(2Fe-2S) ferredoxin
MVVYPEGTWYHGMVADRIPRFVRDHLVEDRPVEDWIFARNSLGADAKDGDPVK